MTRPLLGVAFAFVAAAAAAAIDLRSTALDHGQPYVEVRADPDGESGLIRAAIDIDAPAEVVFAVITDCELAPKMVHSLKSCRLLQRDPEGRWDVREHISKVSVLPPVRNVFRSEYDPPLSVRFHRVGGDLMVYEGAWRLEPRGEAVRVVYEARVSTPFRVPGPLARMGLRHEAPRALLALRRECLARTP